MGNEKNDKMKSLLFELDGVYTTATTPSAGWKAAWRWAGHASRRKYRRVLYGRIIELVKVFGAGETWRLEAADALGPPVSIEAQRGMERAFREIGIEGY